MSALLGLAERCERATGPDPHLDACISRQCESHILPLPYTASIDAAMALVPEGWLCTIKELWDGPGKAGSVTLTEYSEGFWKGCVDGLSATPALALCAAAMKARAA